jgi:hypothetical protein
VRTGKGTALEETDSGLLRLRFIEKTLVTAAAYGVPEVSSAAASLLGIINKDTLDSVMSDLFTDLSRDIRDCIDAVAEREELPPT